MHDSAVIKGSTTINGEVQHDCVTVFGNATVNGKIGNNLMVVLGSVELGPEADVGGQLIVVGGEVKKAPGAQIHGEQTQVHVPGLLPAVDWITKGLLWARPFPPNVGWAWLIAIILLLVNLLLLVIFPQPIQACVDTIERKPITSFFAGILAKLLLGLFIALLAITVVGLIVVPFLAAGALVGALFGKITAYRYVGQQLVRPTKMEMLDRPAITLVLGTAVFYLLYMIPVVGLIAWGFSGVFGLGAVAVAALGKLRMERRKPEAAAPIAEPVYATPVDPVAPEAQMFCNAPGAAPSAAAATPPPPFTQTQSPPFVSAARPALPLMPPQWARAGFWVRVAALALDLVLFAFAMIVAGGHEGDEHPGRLLAFLWLTYCVVMWAWKGTTIGGIVIGLRVVRLDGRPVDFPVALIRGLACILSVAALGLGLVWAGIDPEKRAWHDRIAGTMMLKVPRGGI
jgi:uncharacterized RDD family membrane protein YckC